MPRIDGFQVLDWIRKQPGIRSIPVVVLTTTQQMAEVNRAYSMGANSFLVKPMDFSNYVELSKLIRHYWMQSVRLPETFRPPPKPSGTEAGASD
jgi:CheY-like chemotaxis protein